MGKTCSGCNGFIRWLGDGLGSLFLLAARLYYGWGFINAGWGKFQNIPETISEFKSLGLAWPEYMAYIIATIELVGGGLLLVGLFSRWVSIPLIAVMIGAFSTAHVESLKNIVHDIRPFINEPAFPFLMAALAVFCFGPGKFSLDYWYGGRCSSTKEMP